MRIPRISLRLTRSFFAPEAVSFQTPTTLLRNVAVRRALRQTAGVPSETAASR